MGKKKPGNDLLSHSQAAVREYAFGGYAVPSARQGLTSVFGMGTGGSPALWSPGKIHKREGNPGARGGDPLRTTQIEVKE